MKALVLVGLLSTVYCSKISNEDGFKFKERRIVGGGNYGGFIGLTTYGAGPFLVKGKYEDDDYDDKNDQRNDDPKIKNKDDDLKLIGDVGYEDIQNDQTFRDDKRREDEYIEYLGYIGDRGYCNRENRDSYSNGQFQTYTNTTLFDKERNERCDRFFGFNGPTANDGPENLILPCALDDWQCIRHYFAANSNCKPAYGPIPDPLIIDVNTVFFPVLNLTVALPNLITRGLSNAKITEFYVNRVSGNLVLALNIMNLNLTIPRAYFRYRRTGKESIVLADYATIEFSSVIMTAVIPKVPHLRLDLADIHPDVQDALPPFFIGPGALNSTDPDVVAASSQLIALLPFSIREVILFQAQLFTSIYIQRNICDFGLKIISFENQIFDEKLINVQWLKDNDEYDKKLQKYNSEHSEENYNGYSYFTKYSYTDKGFYDLTNEISRNELSYSEEEKEKLDKIFGYTGPTANDEPENLIRPCALDDWQCIRKYLSANSDCKPAYGPIPDPFKLDRLTIFFSSVNMTISFPYIVARGLSNANVNAFYVNKKSGNLVFAINVQNLNETTPRAYFRYRRTAKESIILADFATVNFKSVILTAVIPKVPHLRLDLADIHVDIQERNPDYTFGPGAFNSTDPDVIDANVQTGVLLPILVREGLLFHSQQLAAIFIQKNICDFGLKLISV